MKNNNFNLILFLLESVNWYRQQGDLKMPVFYKKVIIHKFINGNFLKPSFRYEPINLTYNEYADLILLELLSDNKIK